MAREQAVYLGPRLRRLRRELGLTQADMAGDLDISASYVALLERNQRPVTADMLLRIARTYTLDITDLASASSDELPRLADTLKDPIFADIDLPALEIEDLALNYPGMTEALLRLYTAYREEQLAIASLRDARGDTDAGSSPSDPVGEVQRFLAARRNSFPALDDVAEKIGEDIDEAGDMARYLSTRHGLKVRDIPSDVMMGALRRLDRHRGELLLDQNLDGSSRRFQLATQIAYLAMNPQIRSALDEGNFSGNSARELARRALAGYAAAAIVMPYSRFAETADNYSYDLERLARRFRTSFEQTAHRLTTLQKPGAEGIPFFFIRIDAAGNVSKRLDGAGFPFAQHGGACPLWNVHDVFRHRGRIMPQWIELPDGQKYFSIARAVTSGGGRWDAPRVTRAVALGCDAAHAEKLVYATGEHAPALDRPTPIGMTCRLCHRPACIARSAPPIGRELLPDDYRRTGAPYGFSQETPA